MVVDSEVVRPESQDGSGPAHAPGSLRRLGLRPPDVAAVVAIVVVPVVVLLLLGKTLTAPFWFNEQWRASYFSYLGGWEQGIRADHITSIATGWFLVERWTGELFGSTELSLRMATAIFLVLDCLLLYLLARRWVPTPVACVVALLAGLITDLVVYAVQLAPYDVDAAATAAVLLLYEMSRETTRTVSLLLYFGIGVACFFGTSTLFVAAPVLAFDAACSLRPGGERWRIAGIAGAGAMALVNVAIQTSQNPKAQYQAFASGYPPHGLVTQVRFYWDGVTSIVQNGLTDGRWLGEPLHWVLVFIWSTLIVAGVVTIVRRRVAVVLLVAIVGSLLVTVVTSELRVWPFGFSRTNTYEVPLLILLAAVGASGIGGVVRGTVPGGRGRHARNQRRAERIVAAAFVVFGLAGATLAATYEIGGIQKITRQQPPVGYGDGVRSAVATARGEARPGAAVVVAGVMAVNAWQYYLFDYTGTAVRTGPPIAASHVLLQTGHGSPAETAFLRKVRPSEVFLYIPFGSSGQDLGRDLARLDAAGYCSVVASRSFPPLSGLMETVAGGPSCRPAPVRTESARPPFP